MAWLDWGRQNTLPPPGIADSLQATLLCDLVGSESTIRALYASSISSAVRIIGKPTFVEVPVKELGVGLVECDLAYPFGD